MTRTNTFTLVCVMIRVAALWILLRLLIGLPGYMAAAKTFPHADEGNGLLYVFYGVGVLVAALFWLFADKIARLALTRPQDQVFESDLDARAWFGVALCAIGAWHFFSALNETIFLAARQLATGRMQADYPDQAMPSQAAEWVSTVFELVLGLAFMLGSQSVATLVFRLRYAGATRG